MARETKIERRCLQRYLKPEREKQRAGPRRTALAAGCTFANYNFAGCFLALKVWPKRQARFARLARRIAIEPTKIPVVIGTLVRQAFREIGDLLRSGGALSAAHRRGLSRCGTESARHRGTDGYWNRIFRPGREPLNGRFREGSRISDIFEIQSSQLAAQRASEPTQAFASQMLTDHQKTSDELKSMVQSGKSDASVPPDLDSSHRKMLEKLKGLNGADFTKQYDEDQVSAHNDAVSLF